MLYKIEQELCKVKKPKIPFTNIPNPIGAGKFIYSNGVERYIPLYYLQVFIFKVSRYCKKVIIKENKK